MLLLTAQRNNSYRRAQVSIDIAASRIQALYRRRAARVALRTLLRGVYEKIYDPESDSYFYYCKKTNTSQWEKPKLTTCFQHLPTALEPQIRSKQQFQDPEIISITSDSTLPHGSSTWES